jgi:predicted MFS family arabinose efflux permease
LKSGADMNMIYWLALGAFAVGTEAFMISAVLPEISSDLRVSQQSVGYLIAIFSFSYAISSPILTALTAALDRRKLLIGSMTAFAATNAFAAMARGYDALVIARVLLALSAGLYVPSANALAGALAPHAQRGRALAIVTGGIGAAVALGVPLGAFIGGHYGWRATFAAVALLSMAALAGLLIGLPRGVGSGLTVATLCDRLAVVRQQGVLAALLTTTLWATGAYTVYTFIAPYLTRIVNLKGPSIGYVLFVYGAAAFSGLLFGGATSDRIGTRRVIVVELSVMTAALASLSLWAGYLSPDEALVPVLISVVVWGFAAWGFFPAQQSRLLDIAGLRVAPIILSLNASFIYLGFALGATAGSLTLSHGGVGGLGTVAAVFVLGSLGLFLHAGRSLVTGAQHQHP